MMGVEIRRLLPEEYRHASSIAYRRPDRRSGDPL